MKNRLIQQVAILLFACCIVVFGCEDRSKIREEIKSIESKIILIDKDISYLIEQKRGSNGVIISAQPHLMRFLNELDAKNNREIDAKINELKSRREILMIKLKILMEKL